ncbi:MAG: DUF4912 domain-containing protein [Calothrix sp. MO_192.B10]|nr:DUF4912 domain-containing protein [Calothrix sp. MO_192.B10]
MWQKGKKDHPILNLALLLVLTTTPMAATLVMSDLTWAQSPTETPTFELPQNVPSGTKVRINGSSGMAPINQSLKSSFEKQFSGTEIEIAANSDTEGALKALLDGEIDIAAINHELTPEEKAKGLEQLLVHRDKIALVVGTDNPFKGNLTINQFAGIFRGEITDWSELGGSPGKIKFIDRPTKSDLRQAFRNYPVFQKGKFTTGSNATQLEEDDTAQVVSQLGKDGIGYVLASQLSNLEEVRSLPVHKVKPDNPKYPFSLPSVYVYKQNPSREVSNFLGFTSNRPGQDIIKEAIANQADAIAQQVSTQAAANSSDSPTTQPSPGTGTEQDSSSSTDSTADTTKATDTNTVNVNRANDGQGLTPGATSQETSTATSPDEGLSWWWQLLLGILGALGLLFILGRKKSQDVISETTAAPPTPENEERQQTNTITPPPGNIVDNGSDSNDSSLDLEAPVAVVNPSYPSYGNQEPTSPEDTKTGGIGNLGTAAIAAGVAGVAGAAAIGNHKQNQETSAETSADTQSVDSQSLDRVADAAEPETSGISANMATTDDTTAPEASLYLTTQNENQAYAKWEIDPSEKSGKNKQGDGQLHLRLYDVTDLDLSYQSPKLVKQYECQPNDGELLVEIPLSDRDYMAELGYADWKEDWQPLTRSNIIRVFSTFEGESSTNATFPSLDKVKAATAGIAAATAAATAATAPSFWSDQSTEENGNAAPTYPTAPIKDGESTLVLSNRTPKWAYASWNISETQQKELQLQGGQQLALRLYDVTDIDLSYQTPKLVQQYECDQTTNDRFVAIPISDRNYMAEIGYITDEERWLLLARSAIVRVFSRPGEEFWFVADAELLIHGATEADAIVKFGDRPIKLKPDGTFHLRIPFTDRLIDCIMEAHDGNGEETKTIHKQFSSDSLQGDLRE